MDRVNRLQPKPWIATTTVLGLLLSVAVVAVVLLWNENQEMSARLNNALSLTVGDLNDRLNNAEGYLSKVLADPQDSTSLEFATVFTFEAATQLQGAFAGIPLEPLYRDMWHQMSLALFRAGNEAQQLRQELDRGGALSDQQLARLQETRELISAVGNAAAKSAVIRGTEGVRFDKTAIDEAMLAATSF